MTRARRPKAATQRRAAQSAMLRDGVARGGWGPPVGSEPTQLTRAKSPASPRARRVWQRLDARRRPSRQQVLRVNLGTVGHWPRIILVSKDETMARLHDATDAQHARRTSASTGPTRRRLLKSAALAMRKKKKKKKNARAHKRSSGEPDEYIHIHVKIDIQIYSDVPLYISI